ncbi:olfactory ionotropic receptor IR4 [Penaeus vannamei]|uniref:Olfactory ionotropic receptor IR4 n=1 Tax=Penaeus vannamei TaxID=6689 RepID=A0A3R7PGI8_PENVA|nr:olfactory ionotropic receptor IR4 [Penaeus vannamei]
MQFKFSRAPHFKVAAEEWPPHVYIHKGEGNELIVKGPMGQLMDAIAASLNFTYSVVPGDGYWGAPQENGTWNGMIGTVMRKVQTRTSASVPSACPTPGARSSTSPVFLEMLHVLVSRPLPQPDPWGFLAPFTWYVWVGMLVSIVAVMLTSALVVRALGQGGPASLAHHIWAYYSITFSQSLPWVPGGDSLRVVVWTWMIIMLVFMRSYSGALTSLLAVKTIELKYDSLQDVLDDKGLTLIMEGSTALTTHLKTVSEGVYKELAEASRVRAKYVRASEMDVAAYNYLPDGRHAILVEEVVCRKIYSDHFSRTGKCSFYMSTGNFWRLIYAMIVRPKSPLRELINARILALREFGIYDRWAGDQMPNMTHCLKTPTRIKLHAPYSLADLWAVFLLLGAGTTLAAVVFLCEASFRRGGSCNDPDL